MNYTQADVEQYLSDNEDEIIQQINENDEMPPFMKGSISFRVIYGCGNWLGDRLKEHAATDAQIDQICFVHGQRCAGSKGTPIEWALKYLNEYITTGAVEDKPGMDLAVQITQEMME